MPPDGRFVLAGYEVDLLGQSALDAFSMSATAKASPKLNVPATVSVHPSLGPIGADFEVRLQLNPRFTGKVSKPDSVSSSRGGLGGGLGRGMTAAALGSSGTTASPAIEEMIVHVPLPAHVKNVVDLRIVRGTGDASYAPGDSSIEWHINSREIGTLMSQDRGGGVGATATLRGTVIGQEEEQSDGMQNGGPVSFSSSTYDYDDDGDEHTSSYQTSSKVRSSNQNQNVDMDAKKIKANKMLMPSCATVSFSVKGWLPSGIKVESLNLDQKKSKGLGSGVTPYKGVKYLCLSRKGVECRC